MKSLELKIPPPVVALGFGICMWLVAPLGPMLELPLAARAVAALLVCALGQAIALSGMIGFRRVKTTINPVKPDKATALVQSGIFNYTRNPMYVGLSLTLFGWAIFLASLLPFVFLPLFMLYITRFQIGPEERILASLFGSKYSEYKRRVRRWL